jgi:hypothetical protein
MAEIDFDEWIKNFKIEPVKYFALFDPVNGSISGIYPNSALPDSKTLIEIDDETAGLIHEGKIQLQNCFVDLDSGKFEIAELKVLNKIDDLLHRIVEKQWASMDKEDVYVKYLSTSKSLRFELTDRLGGTKKSGSQSKRKLHWDGSTTMTFLVTEYNDPNIVYDIIRFKIDDIVGKSKTYKLNVIPERFSLYTKRIFPNYIIETK